MAWYERERCRKVHIDACIHSDAQCSSKARLSSAKYVTSSQIGSGFLTLSTCPGSDMTANQYQCSDSDSDSDSFI